MFLNLCIQFAVLNTCVAYTLPNARFAEKPVYMSIEPIILNE